MGNRRSKVNCAQRVVGADGGFLLKDHSAFVQSIRGAEYGQPRFGIALDDRPVDRARAAILGQQRRMILDRAMLRNGHEFLRSELQHKGHDADIGAGFFDGPRGFRIAQRFELMNFQPFRLRRRAQRIGTSAFFFGRAEHSCDFIAAGNQRFQHRFAKILLADNRNSHGVISPSAASKTRLPVSSPRSRRRSSPELLSGSRQYARLTWAIARFSPATPKA